MNNTPSLNEINKNSAMDPNMLTKYYKLKLMNDFMNIKYQNPKMTQSEISFQLNMSSSTIKRYRNDINMLSPYRVSPNNVKKRSKKAKIYNNDESKRPQMTSNDLKKTSNDKNKNKKNNLKGGAVQEDVFEINEHYLDKNIKNNKSWTSNVHIYVIIFSVHICIRVIYCIRVLILY